NIPRRIRFRGRHRHPRRAATRIVGFPRRKGARLMMARRFSIAENLARNASPIVLCGAIALIVLGTALTNNAALDRTVVEALVRIVYVVGLYIFVGNSGVISFGHTAFMAIGA